MSDTAEGQQAANAEAANQAGGGSSQPAALDPMVLERVKEEAIAEAKRIAAEAAAKARQQVTDDIVSKLKPDTGTDSRDLIHQSFMKDPQSLLKLTAEKARRETLEEVERLFEERDSKAEQARQRASELQSEVQKLNKERPDIMKNEGARELLDTFYATTDPNLSEKERVEKALKRFDLAMEKVDGMKPEDRIKKAMDIPSPGSAGATKTPEATLEESRVDRLESRKARFEKKFQAVSRAMLG